MLPGMERSVNTKSAVAPPSNKASAVSASAASMIWYRRSRNVSPSAVRARASSSTTSTVSPKPASVSASAMGGADAGTRAI
jgi:hypothetical protein